MLDIQIAGVSTFKFSGASTSPLLTVTAVSGTNNAKILFTGQGNSTDLTIGASNAGTNPTTAYIITGSNVMNISGGATGSGIINFATTSVLRFANGKNWQTGNNKVFFIPNENNSSTPEARLTFGATAFAVNGSTEAFWTFNGAMTGNSNNGTLNLGATVGIRQSQTIITSNTTSPLIIGYQHINTITATANNQTIYGTHFNDTLSASTFTGVTIAMIKIGGGSATVAPMEWTSAPLLGTPRAGVMEFLTDKWYGTITSTSLRKEFIMGDNAITDAVNLVFGTTTGTKIGTATTQKLAFWNSTPIVQPTTAIAAATITHVGGAAFSENDTIDGYTIGQLVKALRNTGLLA